MNSERKVALVTGSQRGIGRATIIEFAKHGYDVVIDYIEQPEKAIGLKEYVESKYQARALAMEADVREEEDVKRLISATMSEFGRIDVVVNNAGIVYDRDFEKITIPEFEDVLRTNVIGAFIVAREAARHMQSGAIINVSSTNGTKVVSPESLDYNISKVGLQSLTRDLAYQLKPNIRVNAVAIGWADTDMNKDLPADYIKSETERIYIERFADPAEIAKAIYFLASDESSYVNGAILTIDGGY